MPPLLDAAGYFFPYSLFWECPKSIVFWSDIFELVNTQLQVEIPVSPVQTLLDTPDDAQISTRQTVNLLLCPKKGTL